VYSKVKILGHPIHPMLVAYPIALYTSTLVAYVIYAANKDPFFFKAAVAANIAGIVMAAITALPGFIDWAVGIPNGTQAKSHGLTHMLLNVTALVLFIINALIHTGSWKNPSGEVSGIILALLGVLCTVGAGYFGWTMIQTDHVGVKLTPEQERLEAVRAV
jgi:uncharacterized membrane protein